METVDLRKIDGVIRMTKKDVIARRHRYAAFLSKGFKKGDRVRIRVRIGDQEKEVISEDCFNYFNFIFYCLEEGNIFLPIIEWILNCFARRSLTFEELKQIDIKVEKVSS